MKLTKYLAAALLLIPPAAFAAPASGDKDKDEVNRIENAGTVMEEILNRTSVGAESGVRRRRQLRPGRDGVSHGRTFPRSLGRACDVRARRRQRWITDRRTSD